MNRTVLPMCGRAPPEWTASPLFRTKTSSLIMLYCFIRYNKSRSLEIRRSYFLSIMARAGRVMMIAEGITELKDLQREFANLLLSI